MAKILVDKVLADRGLTRNDLAKEIGATIEKVNSICDGRQLHLDEFEQICKYFGCTANDLIIIE